MWTFLYLTQCNLPLAFWALKVLRMGQSCPSFRRSSEKSFSASGGFAPDPLTSTPEIARVTKSDGRIRCTGQTWRTQWRRSVIPMHYDKMFVFCVLFVSYISYIGHRPTVDFASPRSTILAVAELFFVFRSFWSWLLTKLMITCKTYSILRPTCKFVAFSFKLQILYNNWPKACSVAEGHEIRSANHARSALVRHASTDSATPDRSHRNSLRSEKIDHYANTLQFRPRFNIC